MCGFVGCFGASKDLKDKVLLAGQFLRHRGDKKSKPKLCYDDNFSAAFSRLAIKDLNEIKGLKALISLAKYTFCSLIV